MHRHGGDQRQVAQIENHNDMLDLELTAKDGLLAIECAYPSQKDLDELPRLWLTSNETPRDPS
eukprot:7844179-Ditylum_brightwellii.AAC.1